MTTTMMDGSSLNIKKWMVIYPVYINSKKTIAEGRRIGTDKACENPTCLEINDCCQHLKIPCAIENIGLDDLLKLQKMEKPLDFPFVHPNLDKAYPRDFMQRGRVRVMLKREDGSPYNPAITSKKQLMIRVAELVPKHSGRTKKQEPSNVSIAGPSKSGKGGKKKK